MDERVQPGKIPFTGFFILIVDSINDYLQIQVGNCFRILRIRVQGKVAVSIQRIHFEYSPEAEILKFHKVRFNLVAQLAAEPRFKQIEERSFNNGYPLSSAQP